MGYVNRHVAWEHLRGGGGMGTSPDSEGTVSFPKIDMRHGGPIITLGSGTVIFQVHLELLAYPSTLIRPPLAI